MAKAKSVVRGKTKTNGVYRPQEHVSVADAAEEIGCSLMTVLRLIEGRKLAGCRLTDRGWWKVSRNSLDAYLGQLAAQERNSVRRGKR